MQVVPSTGAAGSSATANGSGFPANASGNLCVNVSAPGVCAAGLIAVTTTASGTFSVPFTFPATAGTFTLDVTIGGVNQRTTYTVTGNTPATSEQVPFLMPWTAVLMPRGLGAFSPPIGTCGLFPIAFGQGVNVQCSFGTPGAIGPWWVTIPITNGLAAVACEPPGGGPQVECFGNLWGTPRLGGPVTVFAGGAAILSGTVTANLPALPILPPPPLEFIPPPPPPLLPPPPPAPLDSRR